MAKNKTSRGNKKKRKVEPHPRGRNGDNSNNNATNNNTYSNSNSNNNSSSVSDRAQSSSAATNTEVARHRVALDNERHANASNSHDASSTSSSSTSSSSQSQSQQRLHDVVAQHAMDASGASSANEYCKLEQQAFARILEEQQDHHLACITATSDSQNRSLAEDRQHSLDEAIARRAAAASAKAGAVAEAGAAGASSGNTATLDHVCRASLDDDLLSLNQSAHRVSLDNVHQTRHASLDDTVDRRRVTLDNESDDDDEDWHDCISDVDEEDFCDCSMEVDEELSSYSYSYEVPVPGIDGAVSNTILNGIRFVLTGTFPELGGGEGLKLGKDKAKVMIESFGGKKNAFLSYTSSVLVHDTTYLVFIIGKVTTGLSAQTDILLVGYEPGRRKIKEAKEKGIDIIDLGILDALLTGLATLEESC